MHSNLYIIILLTYLQPGLYHCLWHCRSWTRMCLTGLDSWPLSEVQLSRWCCLRHYRTLEQELAQRRLLPTQRHRSLQTERLRCHLQIGDTTKIIFNIILIHCLQMPSPLSCRHGVNTIQLNMLATMATVVANCVRYMMYIEVATVVAWKWYVWLWVQIYYSGLVGCMHYSLLHEY